MKTKYLLFMLGASLMPAAEQLAAFAPTTALRAHDQAMRLSVIKNKKYHIKVAMESSLAERAYNPEQHRTNALTVLEKDQASIMALRNTAPEQKAAADTILRRMFNPADNGVRGHLKPAGSFSELSVTPNVGAQFNVAGMPGLFAVDVHVPVVRKQISNISFADQTNTTLVPLIADLQVKKEMPNMLQNFEDLGLLHTGKWVATGLGDTAIMGSWRNWFRQDKELVKGVELFAQLGVTLPTGKERDEDQMFSLPLGSDGAFGIPVGLGLNVQFINTFRAGLNIDFLAYLDKAKNRRLKTHQAQTDLFLLNKGDATKDYGLNWQFYLYLQSRHFIGGLSAKAAYQYLRHDTDKLTPRDNKFSFDVVNAAANLQEWHAHNVIFSLDYDHINSSDTLVVPQLSAFFKLPVGGKSVIAAQTVGLQMGVSF
ncbi:hypothetical protein FJ364_00320 [Candidatus Dependentiae bacterium]|nr:hypothetical protein [Candidatus Dependentiae bacterium]